MKNPLFVNSHPVTKLLFLMFIFFVSFTVVIVLSFLFNSESIPSQKILIGFQHIFVFIVPAIVAGILYSKNVVNYLHLNRSKIIFFILAVVIILFAIPIINFSGYLNSKLNLPESMSGLEEIIKQLEETAAETTMSFLNVKTTGGLILNLIIIALLPAIGEELFFRGILLNIFKDWTKNIHFAIIITSVLFSAAHFQFYGFLPRMLLGILFGYLLIWSGSIWLPILAHFINNALAVCLYFFFLGDKEFIDKTDSFGSDPGTYGYMIFSAVILFTFLYFYNKSGKNHSSSNSLYKSED